MTNGIGEARWNNWNEKCQQRGTTNSEGGDANPLFGKFLPKTASKRKYLGRQEDKSATAEGL